MATGGFITTDLFALYNVVQNTQIIYPKEQLVAIIREYFSHDSKYHYVSDEWGFPKVASHADLSPEAGLRDDATTRIFIGQEHHFDFKFYPAVLIKSTGGAYVPISINQQNHTIQRGFRIYEDANGNQYSIRIPIAHIFAGAWDTKFDIDIYTESPQDRSTLLETINLFLISAVRDRLTAAGLFIKSTSFSGETSEDYNNNKIYRQTISLDCHGEYERQIPVDNIVEYINICTEIGRTTNVGWSAADNLTYHDNFTIEDLIAKAKPL